MASNPPLIKGTVDAMVLKALSWGPMHGFEIASWLEDRSNGRLDIEDSALYQSLYRLEERKLVSAEWGLTDNNRRARYYSLTVEGRARLRAETDTWLSYSEAVTTVLTSTRRTRPA